MPPRPAQPLVKNKMQRLLVKLYPHPEKAKRTRLHKDLARFVKKLVSLAKNYGLGLPDCMEECQESWESMDLHFLKFLLLSHIISLRYRLRKLAASGSSWVSQEWLVQHSSLQRCLTTPEAAEDTVASKVREGIDIAKEVLQESIAVASKAAAEGGMMDYDDMLFMPLWLNLTFPKHDS